MGRWESASPSRSTPLAAPSRHLLTKGSISYAYAGVQTEDLTPSLARHLQLPVGHGALVDTVTAGGPAAAAGLRGGTHEEQFQGQTVTVGGDVIVAVNGRPVADAADLVRIVTNAPPGPDRGLLRPARVRAPHDRGHARRSLPALASVLRRVPQEQTGDARRND